VSCCDVVATLMDMGSCVNHFVRYGLFFLSRIFS
jgi:hypothetical protein